MGVLGIGGLFFRARDPQAFAAWYATHLGVGAGLVADGASPVQPWSWNTRAGPVVFGTLSDRQRLFRGGQDVHAQPARRRTGGIDRVAA